MYLRCNQWTIANRGSQQVEAQQVEDLALVEDLVAVAVVVVVAPASRGAPGLLCAGSAAPYG